MVAGARDAEHLELIRSLDLTSVLMVALRARGHVLGAITLARTGRHPNYGEDDVAFVGEVAGRAALALDNARLYGEARARERDSSEAQALLDALVSAAPIGQGFLDTDFRYVRVNDALAEINGVPAIDHIGRTVREVLPATGHRHRGRAGGGAGHRRGDRRPADRGRDAARAGPRPPLRRELLPGRARARRAAGHRHHRRRRDRPRRGGAGPARAARPLRGAHARPERARAGLRAARRRPHRLRERRDRGPHRPQRAPALRPALDPRHAAARRPPPGGRAPGRRARGRASRPSRSAPRSSGPTARASRSRPPDGAWAGRPTRAWRSSRATSPIAWPRSASCSACSRSSRPRAARARPRTPACACWPTRAPCSSARRPATTRCRRWPSCSWPGSPTRARSTSSISPGTCAAPAPTRAPPTAGCACSPWRAIRRSRARCRPTSRSSSRTPARAPCSDAARRSSRSWPTGASVGVLSLGWRDAGRRPARDEWSLVEALAQRIALAVDGALQYRERAHVAQTLQASLLPAALPDIPGATVAAQYVASGEGMDVGGDFYDVFALDDGSWILVIGDVLGKGAEAAAVTALARYTVRAVAGRSPSPAETLAALNDEMLRQRNPDRRFVTAVLVRLEPHAEGGARLVVASGGHPPPVLLRAGGGRRGGAVPGHAAGRRGRRAQLRPGDRAGAGGHPGALHRRGDRGEPRAPADPRGPRRRAARQRPGRRGRGGARGRPPRRGRRGRRAARRPRGARRRPRPRVATPG